MKYTIKIGGYRPEKCHSEMIVSGLDDCVAWLHVLARKDRPEAAIGNCGDYRSWLSNKGFDKIDLNRSPVRDRVRELLVRENELDEQSELDCNAFVPDITVEPFAEGKAMILSRAMRYEAPCKWENIAKVVKELIFEYQDLIAAGELGKPEYNNEE